MAAAAFKVNMTVQNSAGQRKQYYMTATDVNAAAWVFPSGGTELPISSLPCSIIDCVFTAAGTDTTNSTLYVAGTDSSIRIVHGANLGTGVNRAVAMNPIQIPAGATVKFVQNT